MSEVHVMKLHDTLTPSSLDVQIVRVPGGWIYNTYSSRGNDGEYSFSGVFVPFSNEFRGAYEVVPKATPEDE